MGIILIILFVSLMFNAMCAAYFVGHGEFLEKVEWLIEENERLSSLDKALSGDQ